MSENYNTYDWESGIKKLCISGVLILIAYNTPNSLGVFLLLPVIIVGGLGIMQIVTPTKKDR